MAARDAVYVYALAPHGLPSRMRLLGRQVRTVTIGDIDVVVGTPPARPEITTEALADQHALIVELASRVPALLPARFGSALTRAALRRVVEEHDDEIREAMDRVRGRRQMTVRVFGAPAVPHETGGAAVSGTAFLQRRRELAHFEPPEVEEIRRALGTHAADERVETGERGLRVTVFHLVSNERIDAYLADAALLRRALEPHRVVVTGPWPPFAFAPALL